MVPKHPHLSRARGFTLIEIMIVAALISLFSALAIFSMTYLVDTSKRKSAIADVRTIGSVLSTATMDFGVIPKIGYLSESREGLEHMAQAGTQLPPEFDSLGLMPADSPQIRRIVREWEGPYLPNPAQRGLVSSGFKGYFTRMKLAGSNGVLNWPADPWGNPYVVYLLHLDPGANSAPRWVQTHTEKANYAAIVVSYGKNGIPGGSSDPRTILTADRTAAEGFLLFTRLTGNPNADFQALSPGEYGTRYLALHNSAGWNAAGYGGSYLTNQNIPGILDPGSDDLVYQIP